MVHRSALHWPVAGLSIVAFVLLLIATLSVPYIKSLYLVEVGATQTTGDVGSWRFDLGVFGICGKGLSVSTGGSTFNNIGGCSAARLGYNLYTSDSYPTGTGSHNFQTRTLVPSGMTTALVFLPLATAFAGLSALLGIVGAYNNKLNWWTLGSLALTTTFAWISLALSAAVIGLVRAGIHVRNSTVNGIKVDTKIGGTMPLVLVGAVVLSIAFLLAIFALIRDIRANRYHSHSRSDQLEDNLMRRNTAGSDATAVPPYAAHGGHAKVKTVQ